MANIFGNLVRRLTGRSAPDPLPESGRDESLRLLAENSGDVIFRFGPDGRARYISPSVGRLFGCTPKEIYAMGGTVVSNGFVHEDDLSLVAGAVRRHFAGDLPEVKLEFRIISRTGQVFWVETNCSTITDPESGVPTDIIFTMRDISEKKALQAQLAAEARTDGLTGVANRRAFDEALEREWRRAMRDGSALSLLILDIDHFKAFNDLNGHQVGDDCLRTVAQALAASVQRAGDLVARYGGEEFAVILPGTDGKDAATMAHRLCAAVGALGLPHPATPLGHVTVSIGAATAMAAAGGSLKMPEGLLQSADHALYKAKSKGRNCVETTLILTPNGGLKAVS